MKVAGRIYREGRLAKGVLHIEDGLIQDITRPVKADVDFGDRLILPGAIDVHVHFRDPGGTHKEDFLSGTTSAAFGGVTTVVDMPNTLPPTTSLSALKNKHAAVAPKAVVDWGLWSGGSWYTGDLAKMLQLSCGIKAYLGATTGDLLLEDDKSFHEIVKACGEAGKPLVVHAEAQRVLNQLKRTEISLSDHDLSRPPLAEVEAIYDVMKALPKVKKQPRVHVAHVSSSDAIDAARHARFSLGVCPHHVLLHHGQFDARPALGKMNPPLRSAAVRDALWKAFAAGGVVLESDHAPHTTAEKDGSFHTAPAGVPGVETMVPLMLARVLAGDLKLKVLMDAVASAPAALLGLKDRGELAKGMRADFAVYDVATTVDASKLHSKCGWSPFEGMEAIFPTDTYLAGQPVVSDGQLVAKPGSGRCIHGTP